MIDIDVPDYKISCSVVECDWDCVTVWQWLKGVGLGLFLCRTATICVVFFSFMVQKITAHQVLARVFL